MSHIRLHSSHPSNKHYTVVNTNNLLLYSSSKQTSFLVQDSCRATCLLVSIADSKEDSIENEQKDVCILLVLKYFLKLFAVKISSCLRMFDIVENVVSKINPMCAHCEIGQNNFTKSFAFLSVSKARSYNKCTISRYIRNFILLK